MTDGFEDRRMKRWRDDVHKEKGTGYDIDKVGSTKSVKITAVR